MRFSRNFPPRTIKLWNPIACGLPDQYHLRTFKKRVYCILKGQQRTCEVSGVAYHQAIHLLICPLSHKTNMSKRYLRNTSHFIFFLIDVSGSIESTVRDTHGTILFVSALPYVEIWVTGWILVSIKV